MMLSTFRGRVVPGPKPLLHPAQAGAWMLFVLAALGVVALSLLPSEVSAQINLPKIDGTVVDDNDILKTVKLYFYKILELVIYVLYAVVFICGGYIVVTAFMEAKDSKSGWGGFMLTFLMAIIGVALTVYFLSLGLGALGNIS